MTEKLELGSPLDAPRGELAGDWFSCDFAGKSKGEIEYFTAYKSPHCPFRVVYHGNGKWCISSRRGYYLRHAPSGRQGKGSIQLYASAWRAAKRAENEDPKRAEGRGE